MKLIKFCFKTCIFILSIFIIGCGSDGEDATRITLGTSNNLLIPNTLQYQAPFVVQVTDKDGNPAPNTAVTITLRPLQYFKGRYNAIDSDSDGTVDQWSPTYSTTCNAEDTNNNGVLETGEDINVNGLLEPTNPATITPHPTEIPTVISGTGKLTTDSSGFGYFVITYPNSEALWVNLRLTATAAVSGTESAETYDFTLSVSSDDVSDLTIDPPGGRNSRYGTSINCNDAL